MLSVARDSHAEHALAPYGGGAPDVCKSVTLRTHLPCKNGRFVTQAAYAVVQSSLGFRQLSLATRVKRHNSLEWSRYPMTLAKMVLILLAAWCSGCSPAKEYPSRPITIVCPWAAGGGTDRVSRRLALHLERELGVPVSVVNATGGKGVTGHSRGLRARPDGHTITTITLELNMMHWSGLTDLTHEDCRPLMSAKNRFFKLAFAVCPLVRAISLTFSAISLANS